MANPIGNPKCRAVNKARQPHRISREGRARIAAAGAANLAAYKARVAELKVEANEDIGKRLDAFEAELLADLGGSPSAAERALVASARASYTAILLAIRQLQLSPGRLARARGLSAALAAHQNSLLRSLKALGIKRRAAEAPSLDRVFEEIAKEKSGDAEKSANS